MVEKEINEFKAEGAFLDGLVGVLNSLPKPAIQIAVPKRIREMMYAKRLLEFAFDVDNVETEFHSPGSSGSLRLECDSLTVLEMRAFKRAVQLGNNFEIYPLTNGKVRFAMIFYGLFRTAAYQEKEHS